MIEERKRRSVRSDTERYHYNGCDTEAGRLPENAHRPSDILPERVSVNSCSIREDLQKDASPKRDHAFPLHALNEDCAHLFAIFCAKPRRVQSQQKTVQKHYAFPSTKPLSRANFTSCASRRASARATWLPNLVIR